MSHPKTNMRTDPEHSIESEPTPLTMLLVDDHPLVRAGLRAVLKFHFAHAKIGEAGSAPEALAYIEANHPHLVLLDVNLPGVNGLDLARRIRKLERKCKVLMVAGETDPWTVREAMDAGASGFVAKTSSDDVLPQAIRAVLGGAVFLCRDSQMAWRRAELRGDYKPEPPGPAILSTREREVLRYLAQGEPTRMVAALLQISPKTVESHRLHITGKLRTSSIADLTRYAIQHGLTQSKPAPEGDSSR